jgi:CBS domain-containing protein
MGRLEPGRPSASVCCSRGAAQNLLCVAAEVHMSIKNDALKELALARDEARLHAHLFSMDARSRWRELEGSLDNLEQTLAQSGERATEAGLATARHLAQLIGEFMKTHAQPGAELAQPVRSIMTTSVRCCSPSDSLNHAAQLLWEGNCGALPVTDANGVLVGMITDRDVCMASYIQGAALSALPVEGAMSHAVKACTVQDNLGRVLEIMQISQVRRVPVVDEHGRIAGLVALSDVARWVERQRFARAALCDALARTLAAVSQAPRAAAQAAE